MNKIFKVVWSKTRNAYVVVSETAKANGKSSVKSIAATLAVAVMMSGGTALAADYDHDGRLFMDQFSSGVYDNITVTNDNSTAVVSKGQGEQLTAGNSIVISSVNGGISTETVGSHLTVSAPTVSIEDVGYLSGIHVDREDATVSVKDFDSFSIEATADGKWGFPEGNGIRVNRDGALVEAIGNAGSSIKIDGGQSGIVLTSNGYINLSASTIEITTLGHDGKPYKGQAIASTGNGTVDVLATDKIVITNHNVKNADVYAVYSSNGNINVSTIGTTEVTGDIKAEGNGEVNLLLNNAESFLTGAVTTADNGKTALAMNNGATWNVTGDSTITGLGGTDGVIQKAETAADDVSVTVNKPDTGSAMTGATMNVGEGVTLAVSSDDRTGNGIVRDVNISGDGNLEITSDKAWFGLGYGQNEIDVDQLKIKLTDGDTWGAIYSDNLSTGDHIVKANDAQLISGNDAVNNQGPHNIMVDVENKLEIIAEDGYGVMNASQNGNKIDLTAETIEITSKDRTAVKVGHEVGDTGYNGTVNIGDADTKNITIKGAAQNPAGGNERKSAAVYTQGGGTVNLSAAENITIENTNETNNVTAKGAAIGAYDGGTINVDGNAGVVDVKGQVLAAIGTTVTVEGKTVSVTSKEDSIDTWGGTVDIDATESINITSSEKDGIQADDATVTLKGENVTVAGGAWGIKNIDETNSNVVVDGTNVTIKGGTDADEGAIWAMGAGDGEVTVNATGTADIQGEVNVDIGAAVTLKGGTVNVAGGAEDALDACGGTIDVDATNINITSETNDGIQANDATITLDGENVTIDAGNWAIKNLDETDSDVTINATGDVTIKGDAGAIMTSENGSGSVTVNGMGTTTIEGNIKAESNGNVSVLLNTADSLLDGDVTTTNGTTTITMNDGATWTTEGSAGSNVTNLTMDGGIINQGSSGEITIDNLSGTGDVVFSDVSGQVNVLAAGSGATLNLMMTGVDADSFNTTKDLNGLANMIDVAEDATSNVTGNIHVDEGLINGAIDMTVDYEDVDKDDLLNGVVKDVRQGTSTTVASASGVAANTAVAWREEDATLSQRLGELRGSKDGQGVWARFVQGEFERGNDFETEYNMFQIGYDKAKDDWHYGVAVNHTEGDTVYAAGSGELSNTSVLAYGTWLGERGHYKDIVAKVGSISSDYSINAAGQLTKGEYDTYGTSLSAEYGMKNDMGKGWFVTPLAKMTYMHIGADSYTTNNGINVKHDAIDSLVARLGVEFGKELGKKGAVYVKASALHDFCGDADTTLRLGGNSALFTDEIGGTWYEVGFGLNYKMSDATNLYADVIKVYGDEIRTPWQWNAGVRYSF